MRAFDWRRLFDERRIDYIERGANVKRGEINVRCPFCGSADPSHHMGISLETGWYSCWRNRSQHSGKSPLRLIMKLLRVPYETAREIAGLGDGYVDPEGFDAFAARLMRRNEAATGRPGEVQRRVLRMDDFTDIEPRGRTRALYDYLCDARGFDGASDAGNDVDLMCEQYRLRAGTGKWSSRVICPYYMDQELVTWTGRAVGESTMRYRDLDVAESLVAPKETLFNHDAMHGGGRLLVLVEGPFDALKLDFYGQLYGVRAVGLSTNSVSDEQAFLLEVALGRFARIGVMLDQNRSGLGLVDTMRMRQSLHFLGDVATLAVPDGAKDPGELSADQVIEWAQAQ